MKKNKRNKPEEKDRRLIGVCPKCLMKRALTRHHIYPRAYFGKKQYKNDVLLICRTCHDEIEALLPERKLDKDQYQSINFMWMRGYDITVV